MKKIFSLVVSLLVVGAMMAENYLTPVTMYVRNSGGYVIVEDSTQMIVGMSDKGGAATLSDDIKRALNACGWDVKKVTRMDDAVTCMLEQTKSDSVGPLLGNIHFGQGDPYRGMTPMRSGQRCLAGCVAVAMAQIMTYYRHPAVCHGSISYQTETQGYNLSLDLEGHQFDWDNILDEYRYGYTKAQGDAVADLMYSCGVTTRMDYGLEGSGTRTDYVCDALVTFFDYAPSVNEQKRADYPDAQWHAMLQDELKAGRPMLMSSMNPEGAGHAYVLDGYYRLVKTTNIIYSYYHFNWGWEGSEDGWFMLNNLQAGSYDLRNNQEVIFSIMPADHTAISEVKGEVVDNMIYDLLGRPVLSPVAGHIYIQGGKKFVAQ